MQYKTLILVIFIFIQVGILISCAGSEKTPPPVITEQEKSLAISQIKEHANVKDAAISQDGDTLSLVLIVDLGTTKNKAKELGDNFVRLVKAFSKDDSPGNEIGNGIYDYLIGIYDPAKKEIAMGAKSSIARSITW